MGLIGLWTKPATPILKETATMKNSISIFFACASSALAANAIDLFNGKDLQNWESKPGVGTNLWVVGEPSVPKGVPRQLNVSGTSGAMVNMTDRIGNSLDIYSKEKFGSCLIELDLMLSGLSLYNFRHSWYTIDMIEEWPYIHSRSSHLDVGFCKAFRFGK
jgi:hypothetical protein